MQIRDVTTRNVRGDAHVRAGSVRPEGDAFAALFAAVQTQRQGERPTEAPGRHREHSDRPMSVDGREERASEAGAWDRDEGREAIETSRPEMRSDEPRGQEQRVEQAPEQQETTVKEGGSLEQDNTQEQAAGDQADDSQVKDGAEQPGDEDEASGGEVVASTQGALLAALAQPVVVDTAGPVQASAGEAGGGAAGGVQVEVVTNPTGSAAGANGEKTGLDVLLGAQVNKAAADTGSTEPTATTTASTQTQGQNSAGAQSNMQVQMVAANGQVDVMAEPTRASAGQEANAGAFAAEVMESAKQTNEEMKSPVAEVAGKDEKTPALPAVAAGQQSTGGDEQSGPGLGGRSRAQTEQQGLNEKQGRQDAGSRGGVDVPAAVVARGQAETTITKQHKPTQADASIAALTGKPETAQAAKTAVRTPIAEPGRELVDAQQNVERVVKAARQALSRGESRVQLRLDPPELGTLRVEIRQGSNGLTVQLQASTTKAHEMLQGSSRELHAALEASGFSARQVDVQLRLDLRGDANAGQQEQGAFDPHGQAQGHGRGPQEHTGEGFDAPVWGPEAAAEHTPETANEPVWQQLSFAGLDLRA